MQGPLQELKSESSLERVSKKTPTKFKKKKVTYMVTFFFFIILNSVFNTVLISHNINKCYKSINDDHARSVSMTQKNSIVVNKKHQN